MAIRKWLIPLEEGKVRICDIKPGPTSSQDWDLPEAESGWKGRRALHPRAEKKEEKETEKGKTPNLAQPQPPQQHGDKGEENPQGAGSDILWDGAALAQDSALMTGMHR